MKKILHNIKPYFSHLILCASFLCIHWVYWAWVTGIGGQSTLWDNSIIRTGHGDFITTLRSIALTLIHAAQIALNGVALLAMVFVGYLWVTSMGDEEKQSDGKNRIMLVLLGLFLINMPELIYSIITGSSYLRADFSRKVTSLSSRDPGGAFNASDLDRCNYFFCPQNFWGNGTTIAVIRFLETLMVVTAVIMFTIWGFTLLFRGGDESATSQVKSRITYGCIALLVVWFIEWVYRAVFFGTGLNASGIMTSIMSGVNFLLFLAGPIAITYLIIGAYFFITSAGDEERADRGKKILLYTFFATILLLLAYTFLIEIAGLNLF